MNKENNLILSEEEKLFQTYKETKDISIRNKIIESKLPLAEEIANYIYQQYKKYLYDIDYEDIKSYAYEALIQVINDYDYENTSAFTITIYNKIIHLIFKESKLQLAKYFQIFKIIEIIENKYQLKFDINNKAMLKEVINNAKQQGIITNNEFEVRQALMIYQNKNYYYLEKVDNRDLIDDIIDLELKLAIPEILGTLTAHEQEIIKYYYGFVNDKCYSSYDIAKIYKRSQQSVIAYKDRTLKKIKSKILKADYTTKVNYSHKKTNRN